MRDLVDQMGGGRGREPASLNDDHGSHKSDLVDLTLVLHYATPQAWLVSETGDERLKKPEWIPIRFIEALNTGKFADVIKADGRKQKGHIYIVTIPEWVAKEKGLI